MFISFAIQAHPSRGEAARHLADRLGAEIAWSQAPRDVWDTHRRARLLTLGADWSLVIQDDAILGRDFMGRVTRLLTKCDYSVVSLFYRHKPRKRDFMEAARANRLNGGFAWPHLQWGIANAIRGDLVEDALAYCDQPNRWLPDRDDTRLAAWAKERGLLIWYTLPSLVNHDRRVHSLVYDQPNGRRVAWRFV